MNNCKREKEKYTLQAQYKTILNFCSLKYKFQTKLVFLSNELRRNYSSSAHMAQTREEHCCYLYRRVEVHIYTLLTHYHLRKPRLPSWLHSRMCKLCDLSFLNDDLQPFQNKPAGLKGVPSFCFLHLCNVTK